VKWLTLISTSRPDFDNKIQEILDSPGYRHLRNPIKDLIDTIKNKIAEWLLKILGRVAGNTRGIPAIANGLSTIFMIMGIVVVLAIIVVVAVKVSKHYEKKRRVREILGEKIDDKTTPVSLRKKAAELIEKGDYRSAIRYDFIALLLLMHERNLVYLDETKTNEEICKYLKKERFTMLHSFQFLADTFNSTWYGNKPCGGEVYELWNNNINLLWNGVIHYEEKNK
jgi:hypothetical protein